jgi:hypothetical protein
MVPAEKATIKFKALCGIFLANQNEVSKLSVRLAKQADKIQIKVIDTFCVV